MGKLKMRQMKSVNEHVNTLFYREKMSRLQNETN